VPSGKVTFERRFIPNEKIPDFSKSNEVLLPVDIRDTGTIEDAQDALQADFANRMIGGASLSYVTKWISH
jgi:hypothetical protein